MLILFLCYLSKSFYLAIILIPSIIVVLYIYTSKYNYLSMRGLLF